MRKPYPPSTPRCDLSLIGNVDPDGSAMQQAKPMLARDFVFSQTMVARAADELLELAETLGPIETPNSDQVLKGLLKLPAGPGVKRHHR